MISIQVIACNHSANKQLPKQLLTKICDTLWCLSLGHNKLMNYDSFVKPLYMDNLILCSTLVHIFFILNLKCIHFLYQLWTWGANHRYFAWISAQCCGKLSQDYDRDPLKSYDIKRCTDHIKWPVILFTIKLWAHKWKLVNVYSVLIFILIFWSGTSFAHATTAVLLWHVQNCSLIVHLIAHLSGNFTLSSGIILTPGPNIFWLY